MGVHRFILLLGMTLAGGHSFAQALTVSPNPFIQTATIDFSTPTTDSVSLVVINIWGQTVRTIVHDTILPASNYSLVFDGDSLPSGPYMVKLRYGALAKGLRVIKVSNPNGLADSENFSPGLFYPNPAKNIIYFSEASNDADVEVLDAWGNKVNASSKDRRIDISALAKGIYWISFVNSGATQYCPFVKE